KHCAVAATMALLAGVTPVWAASDNPVPGDRVQSWAVGDIEPQAANTLSYVNQTIREIVHTSVGGDQVRVRIANTFGTVPLVIGEAHVAVSSGGSAIVVDTDRVLTFGGKTSVSIPQGAPAVSDPVDLQVDPVSDLAVSIYLPASTQGETTTFLQGSSYVSSAGNFAGSTNLPGATALSQWPFVSVVRGLTARAGAAIGAITNSASSV